MTDYTGLKDKDQWKLGPKEIEALKARYAREIDRELRKSSRIEYRKRVRESPYLFIIYQHDTVDPSIKRYVEVFNDQMLCYTLDPAHARRLTKRECKMCSDFLNNTGNFTNCVTVVIPAMPSADFDKAIPIIKRGKR